MNRFLPTVVALMVLFTSGCATTLREGTTTLSSSALQPLASDKDSLVDTKKMKDLTPDELKLIATDLDGLIAYCKPVLTGLENDSKINSKKAFYLSMAGLVSGAVIAPALIAANVSANAVGIAVASGFAGATNTASEALRTSGLSGTADATTRKEIVDNLRQKLTTIVDPNKTVSDIRIALLAARAECVLYNLAVPTIPAGK